MVKIQHITAKETKAIAAYEKLLLDRFPRQIKRLLLFGSKARGDSRRSSDVDILVVLGRNNRRISKEIAMLTHEPIARFGVLLSPIVIKESRLKRWSPFINNIKKDAITIWKNPKPTSN